MNSLHNYPMDDVFREKLSDFSFEPPDNVWENISKSLGHKKRKPFAFWFVSRQFWFVAFILIALSSSVFLWMNNQLLNNYTGVKYFNNAGNMIIDKSELQKSFNSAKADDKNVVAGNKNNVDKVNKEQDNGNNYTNEINNTFGNKSFKKQKNNCVNAGKKNNAGNILLAEKNNNGGFTYKQNNKTGSKEVVDAAIKQGEKEITQRYNKDTQANKTKAGVGEMQERKPVETDYDKATYAPPPDDYGKRNPLTFGLHFTPEIIVNPFYTDAYADNKNKYAYAYDVTSKFNFNGFFVEGGLGLLYSLDRLSYKIDYEKYEKTGSYQDVQIISFDTVGGAVIPVYQTTTVYTYDTLKSSTVEQKSHNYSYLQIPVYFGYSRSVDKIEYMVKGGISYNYLLNSKEPDIQYFDKDVTVLDIERKTPARALSNWNFLFSAGICYKLSNVVSFSIEPSLRIYYKSIYDRNAPGTNRRPYSIGLKYGLIFNL